MELSFGFTPEQEELRATVRSFLLRGSDKPLWTQMTEQLGLTALAIGEEYGGFGASLVEVAIVLEEMGRVLSPEPYLSTVVAAAAISETSLLADLAAGRTVAALALESPSCTVRDGLLHGTAGHVLDGDVADVVIVPADDGLYAVSTADGHRTAHTTLDQTRGQASFTFEGAPVTPVGGSPERALNLMHAAIAVESIGLASASFAMTVEHLKTRQQFGVPLSTFQALRHRVADLAVALEAATSTAWYAVRVADTEEFAVAAPLAKLVATEAAHAVTAESIQLHGGIGFTWEHPAHRYFKRATANRLLLGDPVTLRRLIGTRAAL